LAFVFGGWVDVGFTISGLLAETILACNFVTISMVLICIALLLTSARAASPHSPRVVTGNCIGKGQTFLLIVSV
jgi:hypothetical protein